MIPNYCLLLAAVFLSCNSDTIRSQDKTLFVTAKEYKTIREIPAPETYRRLERPDSSFGAWLRSLSFKKDKQVHLYNGQLKRNQSAQFAVIDMPVGNKDLQQCADAVMRLRAEYFFSRGEMKKIVFRSGDGTVLSFYDWLHGTRYKVSGNRIIPVHTGNTSRDQRKNLEAYLEFVFSYCGTITLQNSLKKVRSVSEVELGDVLIRGGSPGHAMIVVDVAMNDKGERLFMLAQSYMPAQDIHLVQNPNDAALSPWYKAVTDEEIITPEWTFSPADLRRW